MITLPSITFDSCIPGPYNNWWQRLNWSFLTWLEQSKTKITNLGFFVGTMSMTGSWRSLSSCHEISTYHIEHIKCTRASKDERIALVESSFLLLPMRTNNGNSGGNSDWGGNSGGSSIWDGETEGKDTRGPFAACATWTSPWREGLPIGCYAGLYGGCYFILQRQILAKVCFPIRFWTYMLGVIRNR